MHVRAPFDRLAASLLVSTAACSYADEEPPPLAPTEQSLLGAEPAGACEWPSVVVVEGGCTGVLVHPEIVLTAGHCIGQSTTFVAADPPADPRLADVDTCIVHPDLAYGRGTDVAVCRLREPMKGVTPIPPASGCELDALQPGAPLVAVGFGLQADQDGVFGLKRALPATVEALDTELVVAGDGFGTCPGDSGGPVLIALPDGQGWRVAGILSSVDRGIGCEEARAYYTLVDDVVDWIEDVTQVDVTPCFGAGGTWAPGPGCVVPAEPGVCEASTLRAASCGDAYRAPEDDEPPVVELSFAGEPGTLVADARDAGSGVRQVTFEVHGAAGVQRVRSDAFAPYELPADAMDPEAARVVAIAEDLSGNASRVTLELRDPKSHAHGIPGCAVRAHTTRAGPALLMPVLVLLMARRRKRC